MVVGEAEEVHVAPAQGAQLRAYGVVPQVDVGVLSATGERPTGHEPVVLGQLAFTYLPAMNRIFDSRPLPLADGIAIIAIGVAFMAMLEVEKYLMRDRFGEE